jgi:UDP-N-acetylglucosamine/UDP-N-acetyl-alpha-D-glucosaminouronate 4-epimerase
LAFYLVTGGAGFIGSNTAAMIISQGDRVRVLDNLSTGDKGNLEDLDGVDFIQGDLRDRRTCRRACAGIDYIIHLAALVSVPQSMENPLDTHDINVTGSVNIFQAALDAKVKRVVYASSSAVYGESSEGKIKEGDLGESISPYAHTKLMSEIYADFYGKLFGLQSVGMRYFNVYGPRQNPESLYAAVVPKFIESFLAEKSPTIHGDGGQTRDFIFVKDVARANLLACLKPMGKPEVFNIATGNPTSVNDLARIIKASTDSAVQATHGEARAGDIRHSLADISKAQSILNFSPKHSLENGLEETTAYFSGRR